MTIVYIKRGKELSVSFIKKWNETMADAFEEDKPLNAKDRKKFSKHIFFIVTDRKRIVCMGRLISIRIIFLRKRYNIMGIADIVSLIKKKGYGKILMTSMLKYLKKNKKTGIGFCKRKNDEFYKKCGFEVKKDISKRFIYTNEKGKTIKNKKSDDVIYFEGRDDLMKKILSNQKLKISVPFPW